MVMGGRLLHLELMADVSGAACAHSLQVGDVNLGEVGGCQLSKSGPVLSPLHLARFHQSLSFISLGDSYCNTFDIAYNYYSSDDIQ